MMGRDRGRSDNVPQYSGANEFLSRATSFWAHQPQPLKLDNWSLLAAGCVFDNYQISYTLVCDYVLSI